MRRAKRTRDAEDTSASTSQALRASAALVHPDASFRPQLLGTNRNSPLTGKALAQYFEKRDQASRPSASAAPVGPDVVGHPAEEEEGSDVWMDDNDMGGMEPDDFPVQEKEEEVGGLLGSLLPGISLIRSSEWGRELGMG